MLLSDENLLKVKKIYGIILKVGWGEAVKELLKNINCEKEVEELKGIIETSKGQKNQSNQNS